MASLKALLRSLDTTVDTPHEALRVFRKGLGMTLKEVEEVTGIRESHLSAIENGKISMTQYYAEVFAAAFGLHPTVFLYPSGEFRKTPQLELIERRSKKFLERGRLKIRENKRKKAM